MKIRGMLLMSIWANFGVIVSEPDVIDPTICEVCKYLATELHIRLVETGKSKEVLKTGHGLEDRGKRSISYRTSETRLIEALTEPHICQKILEYNVHKEKKGSLRFAKGRSETMSTLHGLVDKGVNVDLGIPYDLWDSPSAEVTIMQKHCFKMVEDYEDDIEEWYYHLQDRDIMEFLCKDLVLKNKDSTCLYEEPKAEEEGKTEESTAQKSKVKGDRGSKAKKSPKQEL